VRFYENPRYRENNILASLYCAAPELDDELVFSYADIVYRPAVVGALLDGGGDAALVVDREWARTYEGRTQHPIDEAELTLVEDDRVRRVGKRVVEPARAAGEFIGLLRLSMPAARLVRDEYARLEHELGGGPFGTAARFEAAYLTDMLNHLIEAHQLDARPVYIDGGWREIDTTQDLERAERAISW
jgi:choline kinase